MGFGTYSSFLSTANYSIASTTPTKGKLIVAIDSGTTKCSVAYSTIDHDGFRFPASQFGRKEPEIRTYGDWMGDNGDRSPSTNLYYESPNLLPITGHALKTIVDYPFPSIMVSRLTRLWKLMFHTTTDPEIVEVQRHVQAQLHAINKSKEDAICDWVAVIYRELFSDGLDKGANFREIFELEKLDIEIVVPVPPGRSAVEHDLVRKAFIQSGFEAHQVFLVSEPEAVFRAWIHEVDSSDWRVSHSSISSPSTKSKP